MTARRIVADIGGSNARFARNPAAGILHDMRSYKVADYPTFYDALDTYLIETGGIQGCNSVIVGVAGPIDRTSVRLTNSPWFIETGRVEAMLGTDSRANLINDLEAVALALPYLKADDLMPIGQAERDPVPSKTMVAINVGTGFGGASANHTGHGWIANAGEPGHMTIGARNKEELELLAGDNTVEDYLSGRGVPELYARICRLEGYPCHDDLTGAQIFAQAGEDPAAKRLAEIFSVLLGRVAGDIVLAAAAWGGAYLCGSVVNGWFAAAGGEGFRAHFEDKAAMHSRMTGVYCGIITRKDTPLFGASHLPFTVD